MRFQPDYERHVVTLSRQEFVGALPDEAHADFVREKAGELFSGVQDDGRNGLVGQDESRPERMARRFAKWRIYCHSEYVSAARSTITFLFFGTHS
jgi:hypothetical protein